MLSQMRSTYVLRTSRRSRSFFLSPRGSLKDGLSWEKLLQARFEEVERAEWMAIISECMDRGVFA